MNGALLIALARVFSTLSLVFIGGVTAALPEIRRQVVEVHGWMSLPAFAHAFALAQVAPGPNIIVVSLIGWQIAGLSGLLVVTLASMIPSCTLAFIVSRVLKRWSEQRLIALLRAGLIPVALGLILASGITVMRTATSDTRTLLIGLAATGFVFVSSRNPLWAIGAGTLVNVLALHLG